MTDDKPKPDDHVQPEEPARSEPAAPDAGAVPKAVVSRLSLYQRELQRLLREGEETVSSNRLGQLLQVSDAQVRKDLAYFGQFGYPGIGYRCAELIAKIRRILGTDQDWPVALCGVGNLGRALLRYKGFGNQGFRIAAAFDRDPGKIGQAFDGVTIRDIRELPSAVTTLAIRLAILTVPESDAQPLADELVAAGIEGILNFAPVTLQLPPHVHHVAVDLAIQLEQVCFAVVNREPSP